MPKPLAPPFADWPEIPYVGVGCIVERDGQLLLVRDRRGLWSPPGGHLDFRESPAACAVRETLEETGVVVTNVEFVAITNDVLEDIGKHYITIWMRGDAERSETSIEDVAEIVEVGWFEPGDFSEPLHSFFENLIGGESLPRDPANLPSSVRNFSTRTQVLPQGSS